MEMVRPALLRLLMNAIFKTSGVTLRTPEPEYGAIKPRRI